MKLLFLALMVFATRLLAGPESIAIIVDKDCTLQELSLADLRAILHCEKVVSPNRAKWIVVLRQKNSPEHQALLKAVYKCSADDLEAYFRMGEFNGSIDPVPKIVPSPVLVRRIVAGNVSAIGSVRLSEATDAIKILRIDGLLPSDANYPIKTAE